MPFGFRTGPQDVVFYSRPWERDIALDLIMNLPGVPEDQYEALELDETDNGKYDHNIRSTSRKDRIASHRMKLVTHGHAQPRLVPRKLWTPGDWVRSCDPQGLLNLELKKKYHHPVLLMNRAPTTVDAREFHRALGFSSWETPDGRPVVLCGDNPKKYFLPNSVIPNPLGPKNFPWAISILLTSGPLSEDENDWTPGDYLHNEARFMNRGRSGQLVSIKDLVWGDLYSADVLTEFLPDSWNI